MKSIFLWIILALGAAWLWYKIRKPSALEQHFAEEDALSKIGMSVNNMMLRAIPPIGTVGKLPLTGAIVTPTSPQVTDPLSIEAFYTGLFPQTTEMNRAALKTPLSLLGGYGPSSPGMIWN